MLPDPAEVDRAATESAKAFAEVATRPFAPPPVTAHEGPAQGFTPPPPGAWEGEAEPQTWSQKLGVTNPIGAGALDFAEGIASGAASTMFHGGDLIRRATGMERVINRPEVQHAITAPSGIPGQAGKFVEQAAEFAAPMGAVSKLTKGAGLLMRAAAEGVTSGGVAALQSGGDPKATATGVAAGAAGPVVGAGARAVLAKTKLPQRLYQSALKPTWSMAKKDGLEMLDTGIREQIPVSASGLTKVEQKITAIQNKISSGIKARSAAGRTIDSSKVLSALDDLENFYRNTAAPQEALDTLQGIRKEFVGFHGQQIPLDKAQQIKINTYQELKKSYGQMASAKVEGLKQVARGIKEQISSVFPEVAKLNERQSKLIGLDEALTRAVWRIENHQMLGIGSGIAAGAGGAIMGGPGALSAFVGKLVLDDPHVKSRLAIALARAGTRNPTAAVSKGMAALRGSMNEAAFSVAANAQPQPSAIPATALGQ